MSLLFVLLAFFFGLFGTTLETIPYGPQIAPPPKAAPVPEKGPYPLKP